MAGAVMDAECCVDDDDTPGQPEVVGTVEPKWLLLVQDMSVQDIVTSVEAAQSESQQFNLASKTLHRMGGNQIAELLWASCDECGRQEAQSHTRVWFGGMAARHCPMLPGWTDVAPEALVSTAERKLDDLAEICPLDMLFSRCTARHLVVAAFLRRGAAAIVLLLSWSLEAGTADLVLAALLDLDDDSTFACDTEDDRCPVDLVLDACESELEKISSQRARLSASHAQSTCSDAERLQHKETQKDVVWKTAQIAAFRRRLRQEADRRFSICNSTCECRRALIGRDGASTCRCLDARKGVIRSLVDRYDNDLNRNTEHGNGRCEGRKRRHEGRISPAHRHLQDSVVCTLGVAGMKDADRRLHRLLDLVEIEACICHVRSRYGAALPSNAIQSMCFLLSAASRLDPADLVRRHGEAVEVCVQHLSETCSAEGFCTWTSTGVLLNVTAAWFDAVQIVQLLSLIPSSLMPKESKADLGTGDVGHCDIPSWPAADRTRCGPEPPTEALAALWVSLRCVPDQASREASSAALDVIVAALQRRLDQCDDEMVRGAADHACAVLSAAIATRRQSSEQTRGVGCGEESPCSPECASTARNLLCRAIVWLCSASIARQAPVATSLERGIAIALGYLRSATSQACEAALGQCVNLLHVEISRRNRAHAAERRSSQEGPNVAAIPTDAYRNFQKFVVEVCEAHTKWFLRVLNDASQSRNSATMGRGSGSEKDTRMIAAALLIIAALSRKDNCPEAWQQLEYSASASSDCLSLDVATLDLARDAILRLTADRPLAMLGELLTRFLPSSQPPTPTKSMFRLLSGLNIFVKSRHETSQSDHAGITACCKALCGILLCPHLQGSEDGKARNQSISCLVNFIEVLQPPFSLLPFLHANPVTALVHAAHLPPAPLSPSAAQPAARLRNNALRALGELSGLNTDMAGLGSDPQLWDAVVEPLRAPGGLSSLILACSPAPADPDDAMSSGMCFVTALLLNSCWAKHCALGAPQKDIDAGVLRGLHEDVSSEIGALIGAFMAHPHAREELCNTQELRQCFLPLVGELLANKRTVQAMASCRGFSPLAHVLLALDPQDLLADGDRSPFCQILKAVLNSVSAMQQFASLEVVDTLRQLARSQVHGGSQRVFLSRAADRLTLASQRN